MTRRMGSVWAIGLVLATMLAAHGARVEAQVFPSEPPRGPTAPAEAPAAGAAASGPTGAAPEFRGLWVDAYHDGFKTPEQVDRLLADARRANVNALLVQARRRGDAYYARSLEPRTEDAALAPGFDPLEYLIERAHRGSPRLEVHAWVVALPIWGDRGKPPSDPNHVLNQHGAGAVGRENWLMRRDDGQTWAQAYFLDPGHPDAARYTAEVALKIVREYDVDGIHLDYIRYFEGAGDRRWGYNETSVARFNARHSREGQPAPGDPQWAQWRRDQVTALVRRIYLGAVGLKPAVKVSAAVIPWGNGPQSDADWAKASAYTTVFQDWRGWLEEGILDLVMPMNYYREAQAPQPQWFDRWVAWQRDHAYGRQVVPGVALYLNGPRDGLAQARRALTPTADGARAAGVALYSYAISNLTLANSNPADDVSNGDVWTALAAPHGLNDGAPLFATPAAPPPMPWKATPNSGAILLRTAGLDGAQVEIGGPARLSAETDGAGLCAIASVPPGRYAVTVRHPALEGPRSAQLDVTPGKVAELDL